MERPDLLEDPRFRSLALRAEHGDEINAVVAEWCRQRTAREIEEILDGAEVPFSLIYNVKEIVEDPHVVARGDIVTVDDPVAGPLRMQGVYPRLSRTPGAIRHGAPRLGADNDAVYRGLLGLADAEIAVLRAEGVI
jgi:crotonobetainyl-CoA:carnitine CoA-transferase CaiB-like acyl-CoA transferase